MKTNYDLKNDLKNHSKFNKRHYKGRGWFTSFNGDPAKGIDHFNHVSGDAPATDAGGDGGAVGVGESLNESINQYKTLIFQNLNDEEPIEEYSFDTLEEAQEYGKRESLGGAELYQIIDMRAKGGPEIVEEHNPQDEKIDESVQVESLGPGRDEVFALIKELNPNAKEANYIDRDVNQMLAILNKLRNRKSPESNARNIRPNLKDKSFTGVKKDEEDGQLYHYQNGEKGELASEEETDWED